MEANCQSHLADTPRRLRPVWRVSIQRFQRIFIRKSGNLQTRLWQPARAQYTAVTRGTEKFEVTADMVQLIDQRCDEGSLACPGQPGDADTQMAVERALNSRPQLASDTHQPHLEQTQVLGGWYSLIRFPALRDCNVLPLEADVSGDTKVELSHDEYAALLAGTYRYRALRGSCRRRAVDNHYHWLEILLQIPLGDATCQVTAVGIDFAVDQALELISQAG